MNTEDCATEQNKKKYSSNHSLIEFITFKVEEMDDKDPQREEEYTWKHRQPGRVVSIADRVPCQTSVLARILKRHIGQQENL